MMIKSIKMSLEYYTSNFSPYQFNEIRIVEFPRYRIMAEGFPTIIPFSEGYGFIAKFDGTKVAYMFRATAHEVAHQWWGHQVMGANVEGIYLLMESLAQYSALMVTKKEYDQQKINDYMKMKIDEYLRGRAGETQEEVPMLLSNRDVPYVNYDKGIVVMNALQDYIGEKNLNAALQKYIQKTAFQEPPFTISSEFLEYLKEVTPEHLKYIIKDWFETVTLSNNRAVNATRKKLANGKYSVNFQFFADKIQVDKEGEEETLSMNDFITFGVFGADGEELYLEKHKIQSGTFELTFIVDGIPAHVGIDPYYFLIDKNPNDNVIPIK
jgi:ABC-2 type transport system permease protein